jgi:hypothetical protein
LDHIEVFAIESHCRFADSGQVQTHALEKDPEDQLSRKKVALEKNKKLFVIRVDIDQ